MSQKTPNKNDTLLCTHGECEKPQCEDGEFCEEHQKSPVKDMADLCEEAHELTKKECEEAGIGFEYEHEDTDGKVMVYYPVAQAIFDRHYDCLVEKYNI